MKNLLSFCVITLLLLTGCGKKSTKIIISGTITGIEADQLSYSIPINGTSYPYFRDTIPVNSSGSFTIEAETDQPVFITIRVPDITIKKGEYTHTEMTLPVIPGQLLALDITQQDESATFIAQGEYARAINTYMNLPTPSIFYDFEKQFRSLTPEEVITTVTETKEKEMKQFENLKENRELPAEMYELISADRDCYYALAATYPFMGKVTERRASEPLRTIWLDIYKQYPPDNNRMISSPSWYDYTYFSINSLPYFTENMDIETLRNLHKEGKIHTFFLEQARERLSGPRLEYYTALYLLREAFQKQYEKELLTLYEQFIADYPQSKYTPFITQEIEDIYDYHQRISQPAKETIRFMENYEDISSLKEAVKPFKGKKVYIDVWATWCGPCKREFAHKETFHRWAVENGYELIYISIDKEEKHDQWQEMIRYYDLEGYHIRASEALDADLRRIYDKDGILFIPWYIEIDEQGNIREKHARKPSQITAEK